MSLSSSTHVLGDAQAAAAAASPGAFPAALAAFKRTSDGPLSGSRPAQPRLPQFGARPSQDHASRVPMVPRHGAPPRHHNESRPSSQPKSLVRGPRADARHASQQDSLHSQSVDLTRSRSAKLPRLSRDAKRAAPRPSREVPAATPTMPARATSTVRRKDDPPLGGRLDMGAPHARRTRTSSRPGPSQRTSRSASRSKSRSQASTATRPHLPTRPATSRLGSYPSAAAHAASRRAGGLSEDIAAFKIQRAARQRLLYPSQRLVTDNLAPRVRERIAVEAQLEAIRVRRAKRTLAGFFSNLPALQAQRVARARRGRDTKTVAIIAAFVHSRESSAVCAARRRRVEQRAVHCIERAWCRSPLYTTVTARAQDVHTVQLLLRHETLERRELMRQRLAYLVVRHQRAYNDPRVLEAGLGTRHVPLTASSILLGSSAETADDAAAERRLAALLGHSFDDETARTLRLFERRTFFSAQESQLLVEENLLDIAPSTCERPSRCADIFNFETFIHAQYAALRQQQEQAIATATEEEEARDWHMTEAAVDATVLDASQGEDAAAALRHATVRGTPAAADRARAAGLEALSLRQDTCALAAKVAHEGTLQTNTPHLFGSRSAAYQAVLSGATAATSGKPARDGGDAVTMDEVRAAVNGIQSSALVAPTLNTLLVQPRFHDCALFADLAQAVRSGSTAAGTSAPSTATPGHATAGASTFRLGGLCDATTTRFIAPRRDTAARASEPGDPAAFLLSAQVLGCAWSRWPLTSTEAAEVGAGPAHPTRACGGTLPGRERVQCILAPGTGPLLDALLPPVPVTEAGAGGGVSIASAPPPLVVAVSALEHLLVQEHCLREQVHHSWEAQWKSVTLLAALSHARLPRTHQAPYVN